MGIIEVYPPGTGVVIGVFKMPILEYHNLPGEGETHFYGALRIVGPPGICEVMSGEIEEHFVVQENVFVKKPKTVGITNVALTRRQYGGQVLNAETSDKTKVNLLYMLRVRVKDIKLFLFAVNKPISLMLETINTEIRQIIHENSDDSIFKDNTAFAEMIWNRLNGQKLIGDNDEKEKEYSIVEDTQKKYGISIEYFGIVDLVSQIAEALAAEAIARQEGKAIIAAAQAKADALVAKAKGEKEAAIITAEGISEALVTEIGKTTKRIFREILKETESENKANFIIKNSPEEFYRVYGKLLEKCLDYALTAFKVSREAYYEFVSGGSSDSNFPSMIAQGTFTADLMGGILKKKNPIPPQASDPQASPAKEPAKKEKTERKKEKDENENDVLKDGNFTKEAISTLQFVGLIIDNEMEYYEDKGEFSEKAQKAFTSAGLNFE
ncbi:MAG: SPFH domain-containing protein [Candidatus Pacebacteria bacterium]|nr:SPFH domain-containing protein [Candidatus Paceibacterota bacterium]